MTVNQFDIGEEMGRGWSLFKENMGLLAVASVITLLVTMVSFGILGGALTAGLLMIIRRLQQKDAIAPVSGDVFKGFDVFIQTLILLVIVIGCSVVLSWIPVVNVIASLVIGAFSSWVLMLVVFQKMTTVDAIKQVFELTKSGAFTMALVMAVITSLISSLGAVACCVGVFFTMPFALCCMVCAYDKIFGDAVAEQAAPPPEPPADLRL
jgi:hypothetical protein